MTSLKRALGAGLAAAGLAGAVPAAAGAALVPPAPTRTCTWAMHSVTAGGHDGWTSSIATRDSCHWYYDARAKCYRPNGTWYYSHGLWRFSTAYASIAYCGSTEDLTKAWFQKFRGGHFYQVYP